MKSKVVIVILILACAGLGVALFAIKQQADARHTSDVSSIIQYSNDTVSASEQLKKIGQDNLTLSNDLASSQQQLTERAAQTSQLSNSLTAANSALEDTKNSLVSAQQQVTNLNTRIADLEVQNRTLDEQADSLSNRLAALTVQIAETRNKLAVSETNGAFLQAELQKQLAQKAELEHKFNDVDELRVQVKRIRDEMFMARRLQMMKYDSYTSKKGGELLMNHNPPPQVPTLNVQRIPTYDLNVEIGSDGSVKVIPPPSPATNAAPR